MKARGKSFYETWGNTLVQSLRNCLPNSTIRIAGSRADETFRRTSDLDFQIYFGGGETTKERIYPKIIECLTSKLKGKMIHGESVQAVRLGTSGNVVNVTFQNGGKVSFALMT